MMRFFKWASGHWWRGAGLLLVLALTAAVLAPFVDAAPFAGSIQRALEASLGRKVSFREAHFTLLFGPGFSLSDVTIGEDPRFGVEPFAFVPTLDARVRLDRLLAGRVAFSSVRLVNPSLNLVRDGNGSWNMAELAGRLSRQGGTLVHLFPAVRISDGRVDFKLGVRKTNIYLTEANVSIYGESGGKLYIRFEGAPARTDRAGNGFGHLGGYVNWYPHPATAEANQLEGELTLDRSNLSELSTLFQGEDSGVHGRVSGDARIAGPASALHLAGKLRLEDIHRWDLLPSSGEDWTVGYEGLVNLPARSVDLRTVPLRGGTVPVQLALKGADFLSRPAWSVLANLNGAPVAGLLPLARRMGLELPEGLSLDGAISGAVSYSTGIGWTGGVGIANFVASVPHVPPFRATTVEARIDPDRIQLESARITSNDRGWLDVGGDYDRRGKGLHVALTMNVFPARSLRDLFANWVTWPSALDSLQAADLSGGLQYVWAPDTPPVWSGKFVFADGTVSLRGLPELVTEAKGQISFGAGQVDIDQFAGTFERHALTGAFHFDGEGKKPQRVHLVYIGADLAEIEKLIVQSRRESWLSRMGVTRYSAPESLVHTNLQGDLELPGALLNGAALGNLRSRFRWAGTDIQLSGLQVQLPQGDIAGSAAINLASDAPRYKLSGALTGLPWRGGLLSARGTLNASGNGGNLLQAIDAQGTFTGQDVTLSPDDEFDAISGNFRISFPQGWPDLRLTSVQVTDGDEEWTGAAASSSDGKIVLDLEREGRQRHVVSSLSSDPTARAEIGEGLKLAQRNGNRYLQTPTK